MSTRTVSDSETAARCAEGHMGGGDVRHVSRTCYERALRCIPGGVNSPVRAFGSVGGHPIFMACAVGASVFDVDGNEYLDFCQSWGPLILGHAHPTVVGAVETAARRGLSYGACHPGEIDLDRKSVV